MSVNSFNGQFDFFLTAVDAIKCAEALAQRADLITGGLFTPPAAGKLIIPR